MHDLLFTSCLKELKYLLKIYYRILSRHWTGLCPLTVKLSLFVDKYDAIYI